MSTTSSQPGARHGQPLPPGRAFLVLIAIVVVLAGFLGLFALLHIMAVFAGSFFLFAWVGVEKAAPEAFVGSILGAIAGIANASLLHPDLATTFGFDPGIAAIAGPGLLMVALYMLLIHKLPTLFNSTYMLFATLGAIPMLSGREVFASMMEGVIVGAAYFGGLFLLFRKVGGRRSVDAAASALSDSAETLAAGSGP